MPRKCVCVALVATFALAASRSAQAQVTVDVTKVSLAEGDIRLLETEIWQPREATNRCDALRN
jgi:hypothetical protein